MTIESGSNRYPADVTMAGVVGQFVAHRTLDPVRAAALTAAVQVYGEIALGATLDHSAEQTIVLAERFEAWLDPKEAHGTAD